MSSIFISHSSNDNDAAAVLKAWLQEQGYQSVFLDFDPDLGITAGHDWQQTLFQKLRQCQAVIVILTQHWLASKWCFVELIQAQEKGKAIFVLKLESCNEKVLPDIQHVDLTQDPDRGYQRLAQGLRAKGLDPADTFDWDATSPPYPGLQQFAAKEAALFFGRETEIFEGLTTLNRLRHLGTAAPRFVLLLGASGSGKSSLMRAGILPRLRKDAVHWVALGSFRPQQDPFTALAIALAAAFKTSGHPRNWQPIREMLVVAAGQTPPDCSILAGLAYDLQLAREQPDATLLIAIDQFEELLGPDSHDQAALFLGLLRSNLEGCGRKLMVVATMRSDFLGEFQLHPALIQLEYMPITVGPIPLDKLPDIIEKPATMAGVKLEPGLVTTILQDVGSRDALPLLAFMLRRLYDQFGGDGYLEISEYRSMGGVEASVRQAADQVLQEAQPTPEELEALRDAFIPNMVRIDENDKYARQTADRKALPPVAGPLLQRFVEARLLVSHRDQSGHETLEVAHEALLRTWPLLGDWLAINRTHLQVRATIQQAAADWMGQEQEESYLLHRGGRLDIAETLLERPRFLTQAERDYVQACLGLRDRTHAEAEQRRQQELLTAQKLRKTAQRTTIGTLVALGVTVGLSLFAFRELRTAQEAALDQFVVASDAKYDARDPLDALVEALLAWQQLQVVGPDQTDKQEAVEDMVRQAVYGVREKNRLVHHTAINSVSISPDGEQLAAANVDNSVYIWSKQGELLQRLEKHTAAISSVDFSPDGVQLASASADWTVKLWQRDLNGSYQLLDTLVGHTGAVQAVAYSPTGKQVASASTDGTVRVWDLSTGDAKLRQTLTGHQGRVETLVFRSDGQVLASGGYDNQLKLWRRQANGDFQLQQTLTEHTDTIRSVSFSPDSQLLITASDDQTVRLWQRNQRDQYQALRVLYGHLGEVIGADVNVDGSVIASVGRDKTVRLWNRQGRLLQVLWGHRSKINDVEFNPVGRQLATASRDGLVKLWMRRRDLLTPLRGHQGRVYAVQFSPDGELLASTGRDRTIRLWRPNGTLVKTLTGHEDVIEGLAFSPDGKVLASVGRDKQIRLWQRDGTPLSPIIKDKDAFYSVTFSPDGQLLATTGKNKHIKLWRRDGQLVAVLAGHQAENYFTAFTRDGEWLASASADKTVRLWRTDRSGRYQPVQILTGHQAPVEAVAFTPDQTLLVSASRDKTLKLWKRRGDRYLELRTLTGHQDEIEGVAISENGQTIASASRDQTVKIWRINGELVATLRGHQAEVYSVAFSHKDEFLASASADRSVNVWPLDSALNFRKLLTYGCNWVQDYLTYHDELSKWNRGRTYEKVCNGF